MTAKKEPDSQETPLQNGGLGGIFHYNQRKGDLRGLAGGLPEPGGSKLLNVPFATLLALEAWEAPCSGFKPNQGRRGCSEASRGPPLQSGVWTAS